MIIKKHITTITLLFIFLTVILIYVPGLKGGFIFDDYSNLGEMSKYGDLSHWENAKKFITNGIAGPSGRPISLATFVPTASYWPLNATPFKIINLILHLICGYLLFLLIKQLLKSYGFNSEKSLWIAILGCGFWLLHPFFVSTTLYVIQRMTQLAMLFSLIGILGYLYGRILVETESKKAYLIMSVSIVLSTILATFSKENGALLPLLILIIEFCNPSRKVTLSISWKFVFLWIPSIVIIVILGSYINFSENIWANRNFNQIERLYTEARILIEYLGHLLFPEIEGNGLFQDGYHISSSIFNPITTFYSIVLILSLILCAIFVRKKYPLFSLSILFFFAAHLMESTVIGLELYFEHRNYLAAMFIFLPVASGLYYISKRVNLKLGVMLGLIILSLLSWMTWQRVILWSDSEKLLLYWAQKNPNSERAQSLIAIHYAVRGDRVATNRILEEALKSNPNSGLLSFQWLLNRLNQNTGTSLDFDKILVNIKNHRADPQAIPWIRDVAMMISKDPMLSEKYGDLMLNILNQLMSNDSKYRNLPMFKTMMVFLQAMILSSRGENMSAIEKYHEAYLVDKDIDMGISIVSDMGNRGYKHEALDLLSEIYKDCVDKDEKQLNKSKEVYLKSMQNLRLTILNDISFKENESAQLKVLEN